MHFFCIPALLCAENGIVVIISGKCLTYRAGGYGIFVKKRQTMRIICISIIIILSNLAVMAQDKEQHAVKQTAGRDQLGGFAPKFAELNDDVLFGEVWSRTDSLCLRDRSIVTLTALISMGITDSSLTYHLQTAKANGITRTEIAEILTHLGFYAGWPKAWAAFRLAKEVWNEEECGSEDTGENLGITDGAGPAVDGSMSGQSRTAFEREMLFPIGTPNDAYAKYFTGNSYLAVLSSGTLPVCNVSFEPGCRNNWHIHRASEGGGQILLCVAGRGWYQEWGKPAVELKPGDTVTIPANVKHWHGAAADSWFAHIAIEVPGKDQSNEWLEPVDDRQYGQLE